MRWLIGGYGPDMSGTGRGVYAMAPRDDGTLAAPSLVAELPSPSYLLAHEGRVLAALEGAGEVADVATGVRGSSGGTWPCHLSVHDDAIVVTNYFDGIVGVLDAASLALLSATPASAGAGGLARQESAHVHSSVTLPSGELVIADLGANALHVHRDGQRRRSIPLPSGFGPRDLLLRPSGVLLVLGELSSRVLALDVTPSASGGAEFSALADLALPDAAPEDAAAALVPLGDDHVVTAVRGTDRVHVLRVSTDGRSITPVASAPVGSFPRHLAVDGDLVHAACQLADRIDTLRFTGTALDVVGSSDKVPSPTFLMRSEI